MSSFKEMASERPFFRITVLNIADYSGINKNTFYYHFEDKSDLIRSIFRVDLGSILHENFDKKDLVYPEDQNDKYSELPFYINARNPEACLDCSPFFVCLSDYLLENVAYYSNIFCSEKPDGLKFYFHNLYLGEMRKDILYALGNWHLPEADIDFLAQYFTSASFDFYFSSIPNKQKSYKFPGIEGVYNNITHNLMKSFIEFRTSADYPFGKNSFAFVSDLEDTCR